MNANEIRNIEIRPASSLAQQNLQLERVRGEINKLKTAGNGIRTAASTPALAILVTSTPPASGQLKMTATWSAPTSDPALGGALMYAGLMALRQQAPAVFAACLERLQSEALVPARSPLSPL